ncbi:MAG: DUF6265 family protein [Gammaproteobacteria bacterium]|nr:DUF6265 family protein [Gammaproteobacteria bacterium]
MRTLLSVFLVVGAVIASTAFADHHMKPTVADLAWMSGSWSGPAGPGTLEENWIHPVDGSIASLVRMTGGGTTSMVELIVIEEEDDTLVLRIKQWDPGFSPRTPNPQKMILASLEKNRVSFKATEDGGMSSLTYARPTDDAFTITVETNEGAKFDINLSRMK